MKCLVVGRGTIAGAVRAHLQGSDHHLVDHGWDAVIDCSGTYDAYAELDERIRTIDNAIQSGARRIIAMSGGAIGSGRLIPARAKYVAAKYALYGYVEQVCQTLPKGHTINLVAPGPVLSRMTAGEIRPDDAVSPVLAAQCVWDLLRDDCRINGAIVSAKTGQWFFLRGTPSDRTDVATLGTREQGSLITMAHQPDDLEPMDA